MVSVHWNYDLTLRTCQIHLPRGSRASDKYLKSVIMSPALSAHQKPPNLSFLVLLTTLYKTFLDQFLLYPMLTISVSLECGILR